MITLKEKRKYLLPFFSLLLAIAFYWWMQQAPDDQPLFLLYPICWVTSILSGVQFLFRPGYGFFGFTPAGLPLVINKTCSGGVFFVICFTLLCITQLPRLQKTSYRLLGFFCALLGAYATALIASILRITSSILLFDLQSVLDSVLVHNIVGIISFITILCLCYFGAETLVTTWQEKRMVHSNE